MATNSAHTQPPLSAEELLSLDNVPARREAPPHVVQQLATRLLHLSGGGERIERAVSDAGHGHAIDPA